ncbi:helix-turn-helix transcriptional regulator [Paraburkholderia sp. EG285A]|uniref:helix-turn-helix transcriptional regulator n=1 Tax=Paraburkholderia sp. EG285A TaxID=3237009 RepID=UPI0034D27270
MDAANPVPDLQLGQFAFVTEMLGNVAQAVGSLRFAQVLYENIVRLVDCDAVHLDYEKSPSGHRNVGWIGSYGRDRELVVEVMQRYYQSYANEDATYEGIVVEDEVRVLQVSAQKVETELRHLFYDIADIHDECVVAGLVNGTKYSMSVSRGRHLPQFSLKELSLLKHLALVVLPLADSHRRLAGAIPTDGTPAEPADRNLLARWLPHLHGKLTPREAHVCSSFINGLTTQAIAQAMGVKASTVNTYAKRAFEKLGVDTRRQLVALVLKSAPLDSGERGAH